MRKTPINTTPPTETVARLNWCVEQVQALGRATHIDTAEDITTRTSKMFQPLDEGLTALAGLPSGVGVLYQTADNTFSLRTDIDADIDALEAAVAAAAPVIAAKAGQDQVWEQSWVIEFPENKDYKVVVVSQVPRTITRVTTQSAAGTGTLTVKINTTALGGSANSVSGTTQSQTHSTANVFLAGNDLVLSVSSASSDLERMTVTIAGTLVLDP